MDEETIANVLEMTKASIPIKSTSQDTYLKKVIKAVDAEVQNVQGISLDYERDDHFMLVVDMVRHRFENRHKQSKAPGNIRTRLTDIGL